MKAIVTKFHGATNTRGSRISASDMDGNRVFISFPHELSGEAVHIAAAQALCDKMNWPGNRVVGAIKAGYVHVFAEGDNTLPSMGDDATACAMFGHMLTADGAYCKSCGRVNSEGSK